jgi:peptidoglycan/xylan/chitin deacetylase (PgdA/CDA1 family)
VGSRRQYSAKLVAAKRGHWRVRVEVSGTASHTPAAQSAAFKSVGAKVVALTFDDGPWPTSTAAIIKALKANDAQATFFTLGSQIKSRAALVKLELANGNAVGVHSWNHALMTRRSASVNKADLAKCKKTLIAATGVKPVWFRPPYGATGPTLKKTAASVGLRQVIWTVDTLDWKYRTQSSVVARALGPARDGSIILMHDGGGPRGATVAAVPVIIRRLRAKGFDFVTLDEMAALGYRIR